MPRKKKGKGKTKAEERGTQAQQQQQQTTSSTQDIASAPVHSPQSEPKDEQPSTSQKTEGVKVGKDVHTTPETLSSYMQQTLTLSTPLVKRPDYGSRGRKIDLIVNYFPVELPTGNVYHYDVEISLLRRDQKETDPKGDSGKKKFRCMNTKKNREVIQKMFSQNREFHGYIPAYDGEKNLYTKMPLKAVPIRRTVELQPNEGDGDALPRGDVFEVLIKPVIKRETNDNSINLDMVHALYEGKVNHVMLEAIMALETILRNGPCFRFIPVGRSFFYPPLSPEDMHPLSGGKEIWFGHHQSLILTEWKPVININVTATTFRKSEPLIAYVCEILQCAERDLLQVPYLRDADVVLLSKKLKNVRVKVTHLSYEREYRVLKLTRESSKDLKFCMSTSEGQREINVFDYFSQNYGIILQFPRLPCLHVHPKDKKTYLPLEVCKIVPGQHSNERLTEEQTREMIKVASIPPDARFRKIQQVFNSAQFNRDPCNAHFGIKVSPAPLSIEGRIIEAPNVTYSEQKRVRPKDGSWEMKSEKFLRGAVVNSWMILSFVNERFCTDSDLNRFADLLRNVGRDCGLILGRLECVRIFGGRHVQVERELEATVGRFRDVKFAVIVLQNKNSPLYGEIKQVSETKLCLITQCVLSANVKKSNRSVVKNICLKINAKMDGINCSLTPGEKPVIFNNPVIIFGADVTHPPPGSNLKPSIAAVVASLDYYPSRYAVELRAQMNTNERKKAAEIIDDLEAMVKNLLKVFYRETKGEKPEKIIFYRDGVSRGEFLTVRDFELCAIRKACESLQTDYKPAITHIVVQKRHHTRFIPRDLRDGIGPRRNVPPGTVVDRGASSIIDFDFFLCSHFGLQGTSRPGHYTVIWDDSKFSSDELQKLTYYLCHIYARCTRSISIPAPVAYAHLAAYRASKYLAAKSDECSASASEISTAELRALWRTWITTIAIRPEMTSKLFFV